MKKTLDDIAIAKEIIKIVKKENITKVSNCITRLRLTIKDIDKVDIEQLKKVSKVKGVQNKETLQIILGIGLVDRIRVEVDNIVESKNVIFEKEVIKSKINIKDLRWNDIKELHLLNKFTKVIQGIFIPILPIMIGIGIIQGIFGLLVSQLGVVGIWPIDVLLIVSSVIMGSIGTLVGWSASKHFNSSPVWGIGLGIFLYGAPGVYGGIDSIKLGMIEFHVGMGGVIGIILGAYIFARLEKFFKMKLSDVLHFTIVPIFVLLIGTLLFVTIVLPFAGLIDYGLGEAIGWAVGDPTAIVPIKGSVPQWIIGMVVAPLWILLVITGLHWSIIGVLLAIAYRDPNNYIEWIFPLTAMCDIAIFGTSSAVLMRTKSKETKSLSSGSTISAFFGVSEPTIFGMVLPNIKLLIPIMVSASVFGAALGIINPYFSTPSALGVWAIFNVPNTTMMMWFGLAAFGSYSMAMVITIIFYKFLVPKELELSKKNIVNSNIEILISKMKFNRL